MTPEETFGPLLGLGKAWGRLSGGIADVLPTALGVLTVQYLA